MSQRCSRLASTATPPSTGRCSGSTTVASSASAPRRWLSALPFSATATSPHRYRGDNVVPVRRIGGHQSVIFLPRLRRQSAEVNLGIVLDNDLPIPLTLGEQFIELAEHRRLRR